MSEAQQDVKPKLNISVNHQGQIVTVKVKATTPFARIFEAAEKRFNIQPGTLKFTFEGTRLRGEETPAAVGLEDEDVIDAYLEQVGGSRRIHGTQQ